MLVINHSAPHHRGATRSAHHFVCYFAALQSESHNPMNVSGNDPLRCLHTRYFHLDEVSTRLPPIPKRGRVQNTTLQRVCGNSLIYAITYDVVF